MSGGDVDAVSGAVLDRGDAGVTVSLEPSPGGLLPKIADVGVVNQQALSADEVDVFAIDLEVVDVGRPGTRQLADDPFRFARDGPYGLAGRDLADRDECRVGFAPKEMVRGHADRLEFSLEEDVEDLNRRRMGEGAGDDPSGAGFDR